MSSNIQSFVLRAEKAEKEIELLTSQIRELENGTFTQIEDGKVPEDLEKVPEEFEKLRTENFKLKYRIGILQRATELQAKKGKTV